MNVSKKVMYEFLLIPFSILNFLFSFLCFGTDLILKKIKAKDEALKKETSTKFKALSAVFNILLVGIPFLSNECGKLIRKFSDKISEAIDKVKE